MIHLTAVEKRASFPQEARFPYNVPVIARLESVRFETAVTFLVGGKGESEEERGEREHHNVPVIARLESVRFAPYTTRSSMIHLI